MDATDTMKDGQQARRPNTRKRRIRTKGTNERSHTNFTVTTDAYDTTKGGQEARRSNTRSRRIRTTEARWSNTQFTTKANDTKMDKKHEDPKTR
jgi:hypothetical protein